MERGELTRKLFLVPMRNCDAGPSGEARGFGASTGGGGALTSGVGGEGEHIFN